MRRRDLADRTKAYALRIIRLYAALPGDVLSSVIGKQMLRAGTSVGAHYREATHARSRAEFTSKISVGLQELEETAYWLELLSDADLMDADRLQPLIDETRELIAIFVTIVRKSKTRP